MRRNNKIKLLLFLLLLTTKVSAQQTPDPTEQQLENLAETASGETEDDHVLQEMDQFRRHPVNLNTADESSLRQFRILSELQILSFIRYRELLGKLLNVLELQAVPGWDAATIRLVQPYVHTGPVLSMAAETGKRFREGEHLLLLRVSQSLEQPKEFRQPDSVNGFQGSPQQLLLRHTYRFKQSFQYGFIAEKDAGEPLFKGAQRQGFDFYSAHVFVRHIGRIQALAVGDFTVNMGQGLIHWQSLAFKKSTAITAVKRQSPVLRPYHSSGEYNFHRGVGVTVRNGSLESTLFVSYRRISANRVTEPLDGSIRVTSVLTSGYHRNNSEQADRNQLSLLTAGFTVRYRGRSWQVGINGVNYMYSLPVVKRAEPYNLYAINGKKWTNLSLDYSYTLRNIHLFGEAAADKRGQPAFLNGVLMGVDPRVDLSLVHRLLAPGYQSVYGNAFTENSLPGNENGLYAGISIRPVNGWKLDAYIDVYRFPWLRSGVDAPGTGTDRVVQISYSPSRETVLYTRFRSESKQYNLPDNTSITNFLEFLPRQSWRTQLNTRLSASVYWRNRVELVWYDRKGQHRETGFLGYSDVLLRPAGKPWSGGFRLQYVETEGYNSRIYAFENDVLYSYSIPAFFDQGYRYYVNVQAEPGKRLSIWIKWSQTIFTVQNKVLPSDAGITGPFRSSIKLQIRYIFQ